jgi:hypothetical protein
MEKDNAMKVAVISGIFAILAAIIGALFTHWFGLATPSAQATPTRSSTSSSSTITNPTAIASATSSAAIYYKGPIGISSGGNGLDFDMKPLGPGPGPASFFYNTFALQTGGSATDGFAVWPPGRTPTASDCTTWVSTHLAPDVVNPVAGMNICFKTDQGRIGFLNVQPGTSENQFNAIATVWGS